MDISKYYIIFFLTLFTTGANAQWTAGGSYSSVSEDDLNLDLAMVSADVAYQFSTNSNYTSEVLVRLGTGVADDSFMGVGLEIDRFFQIAYRAKFDMGSGLYFFAVPSYANLEVTASAGAVSETADDWEFGFGGGIGYDFSDALTGELSYEAFDGTDFLTLGLRFDL